MVILAVILAIVGAIILVSGAAPGAGKKLSKSVYGFGITLVSVAVVLLLVFYFTGAGQDPLRTGQQYVWSSDDNKVHVLVDRTADAGFRWRVGGMNLSASADITATTACSRTITGPPGWDKSVVVGAMDDMTRMGKMDFCIDCQTVELPFFDKAKPPTPTSSNDNVPEPYSVAPDNQNTKGEVNRYRPDPQ